MAVQLASFPNSRIKPRPARTQGDTQIITIPSGVATLVAASNTNRTGLLLRNLDEVSGLYYGYDASIDDQVGANGGMYVAPLDVAELDDPGQIYVYQISGGSINISLDEGEG